MGVDRAPADDDSVTEVEKEIDLCAQTIRDFVQHPIFDAIIIITVVVNTVLMVTPAHARNVCALPRAACAVGGQLTSAALRRLSGQSQRRAPPRRM
jgi:hypothetical protein